jgi:hypothetical protein
VETEELSELDVSMELTEGTAKIDMRKVKVGGFQKMIEEDGQQPRKSTEHITGSTELCRASSVVLKVDTVDRELKAIA